jgi:hypothetical protein
MKSSKLSTVLALGAIVAVAVAGSSIARDPADVEVTIKSGGEVHGQVKSDRNKCKREVPVKLVRKNTGQIVVTDTTEEINGKWKWNAGNPGQGRYYAKISAKQGCDADRTETVRVN